MRVDPPLEYTNEDPRQYKNETALVDAIRKQIAKEFPGAWVLKTHGNPYQESGLPDLLVAWDGHFAGLEVKHPKKNETEEHARYRTAIAQRRQIVALRRAGIVADTVLSVAETRRVLHWAFRVQGPPHHAPLYDTAKAMELFEKKS